MNERIPGPRMPERDKRKAIEVVGWMLIAAGVAVALYFLAGYDTTVEGPPRQIGQIDEPARVENIGRNVRWLGGVVGGIGMAAAGAILTLHRPLE